MCPYFQGGAKKQPVPWHGDTGQMGALDYISSLPKSPWGSQSTAQCQTQKENDEKGHPTLK